MAPQVKTIAAIRPEGLIGGIIREGFGDGLKKHSFFSLSPNRMSNYLALRSSAAPTFTVSTLLAKSISIQSTTISLGQSTNQSYTNFSNGSFTTGWASTLTGLTSIKDVVLSPNGSVQTILQNSGSTMSTVITSLNSGQTWTGSTMRGLPTSGALPYQTYGSTINAMPVPSITAITAAPSSGNQLAIASNELVYASANSGATFAATGLGQNNSPFIYLPFDGSVADVMGNSAVTATGSPAFVTGKVGTNAVNLANTAGGTAIQYVRGTWTGSNSFTVSFWFNAQTLSGYANLFITANATVSVFINAGNNVLILYVGGTSINGPVISTNTWYNITAVYQNGGTSSLYVNNAFYASGTGSWNPANITVYGIGAQEIFTAQAAFNGYIDDFRLYNYAVTNPSGAALINPLVGPIMPFVYLTFDGSTTTDLMGNSTTTATGSPGFVAGQVGSNAINFVNSAGVAATRYVVGTWTGATNFTISLWLNYQTAPLSTTQVAMSLRSSGTPLFDIGHNTSGGFVQFYYGAGTVQFMSLGTLAINTWYRVTFVYQQGGTSSAYLNEQLISSVANSPALQLSPTTFELGSRLTGNLSFNGYIDDFRIYNGAFTPSQLSPVLYSPSHAVGSPNIYLPFENGSVLDAMGYSAVSARGTMNFVPGVVGTSALNLVNPSGGTATNFLYGSWSGSPNFTISGWFNTQALAPGGYQVIFCSYNFGLVLYINPSNQLALTIPSGGAGLGLTVGPTSYTITPNTWYHFIVIFQTNGLCSLYVNNALVGSATNTSGVGTFTVSQFALGRYDVVATSTNAFNGYIDDFKLYNCAVPFSALGPMNYTQAAISNSGAYQIVAAANGGVYTSANSGSTWSQATTSPQVASAVNTVGGQVITPALAGITTASWTQNGVTWTASSSTNNNSANFAAQYAFNTLATSNITPYSWASNATYTNGTGVYTGAVSTTIIGVGAIAGEWIQLQSSVPLVMNSYSYGCGAATGIPKVHYIIGSNDGINWYPIQMASMTTNPLTASFTACTSYLLVNQSGTQTITGGQTGSGTFTTYPTTTNAYTYFRVIANSTFNAQNAEYTELFINFATPATPLYVAPSTALIANQSLNAITVMPQQTGLASSTWTTNGVSWTASASTTLAGSFFPYFMFDTNFLNRWVPSSGSYTTAGNSSGVSNTIIGIAGTQTGDWLQIQSSVPLVMSSYQFATSGTTARLPKTYYITGSNDGTNWYPLQYASAGAVTTTAMNSLVPSVILVNSTSTQTFGSSTVATTAYPTSTNAYTYFRLVSLTSYSVSADYLDIGEWVVNFTAYTPALLQSLSMSPSGQYMALTGAGATAPNSTAAVAATWAANGVSWTSSISSQLGGTPYPYFPFQNTNGGNIWISLGNYSSGVYNNTYSTTVLGGIGTVNGEWLQIQSSVPLVITSYTFQVFNAGNLPKSYYIVGSSDGTTWYPIQLCVLATNPITSTNVKCSNDLLVNFNGIQTLIGNVSSAVTTTAYTSTTTNAYTYFRIIVTSLFSTGTNAEIGEWYINFQSGPTFYSTDYGSSWTRSLTAATIPNANVLATSGNGQYSLQACGQTVFIAINTSVGNPTGSYTTPTFSPALSSATGAVSNAAVSASGQYMVVLIQSTSNNVYYSSNYGVSFTGITLGSTAMVSCAVSADGSYVTVANATQVFTLNSNTQGLSITVGNQSGLINQGQNAVAIGNQAGLVNQSANSIVLNSSGTAVNAYAPGFFVAPVASAGSSVSSSFAVLGYGTDNQVVQTGMTMLANGFVGIGTNNPTALVEFGRGGGFDGSSGTNQIGFSWNGVGGGYRHWIVSRHHLVTSNSGNAIDFYLNNTFTANGSVGPNNGSILGMSVTAMGVGIGTTSPSSKLHIVGDLNASAFTINNSETGWGYNFSIVLRNNQPNPSVFQFLQKAGGPGAYHSLVQGGDHVFLSMDQRSGVTGGNGIVICGWDQVAGLRIGPSSSNFSGNVGIGLTNPSVPLHVGTYINTSVIAGNWTAQNYNTSLAGPFSSTQNISAYFLGYASSSIGFLTYSDKRIKKDIEPATNCLDTILQLQAVTYRKKNVIEDGNELHTGFIAQEVQEVYPSAIHKRTDTIPSIYAIRHAVLVKHGIQITESIDVPLDARVVVIDFRNKKIQMIHRPDNVLLFEDQADTIELDGDKVFIFGHEVSDKLMLNKDTLFAVGMGAIKELAQKHDALTATCESLLTSQASLLAWAQSQGFSGAF